MKQQLGKFELASGGTLFLDEIGDLRLDLQAKLLRAIQEGEIERVGGAKPIRTNFRLVVATNVDLEKAVRDGRFREDLYYRINVIPIRMPPLRERVEDLPELARLFLERYRVKFRKPVRGLSDSALKILASYWWPGNIRELENLIERLVAVSDREFITDEDLPLEYHFAKLDSGPATGDDAVPGGVRHLRAQLHPARARKEGLERHRDRPLSRHPPEHAQAQDGPPRADAASPRSSAIPRPGVRPGSDPGRQRLGPALDPGSGQAPAIR